MEMEVDIYKKWLFAKQGKRKHLKLSINVLTIMQVSSQTDRTKPAGALLFVAMSRPISRILSAPLPGRGRFSWI